MGPTVGGDAMVGRDGEQTTARACGAARGPGADRARRRLFPAMVALCPALLGCSASPSSDNATGVYPSQSVFSLFKHAPDAAPAVQTATPAVVPGASGVVAAAQFPAPAAGAAGGGTPLVGISASGKPPVAMPAVNQIAPPPPSGAPAVATASPAPDEDEHSAASVYPSVAVFDLFRDNAREQAAARAPAPPLLSDSAATATKPGAPGQPAAATPNPQAAASPDEDEHSAASVYPSVPLFGSK